MTPLHTYLETLIFRTSDSSFVKLASSEYYFTLVYESTETGMYPVLTSPSDFLALLCLWHSEQAMETKEKVRGGVQTFRSYHLTPTLSSWLPLPSCLQGTSVPLSLLLSP